MSVLALSRGALVAASDGWSGDDIVLLGMLSLISLAVISQAVSLLRTMPGTRGIWRWVALARRRRSTPASQRPLLGQPDARALFPQLPAVPERRGRFSPAVATTGWVALTLLIMAAAFAAATGVAIGALRSLDAGGWSIGTVLSLGFSVLISYGVTVLSVGLVRSWFERRRRRLRRMLMRLLRYLLRGFDRTTTALRRMLGRFDKETGVLGRGVLATGGAALIVAASFGVPVVAAGDAAPNPSGAGEPAAATATATTVVRAMGIDHQSTPEVASVEDAEVVVVAVSDPAPDVTVAPTAPTTTTIAKTATTTAAPTTTVAKTTTTSTVAKTTTTSSSTTTLPPDTTGPTINGVSDGPDPIFTSGTAPDTSQVSASASDPSGVANMTVYYRLGGGGFSVWTSVKGGSVSTTFGPFGSIGTYEYRIMATDTLGNTNCKTPAGCPGGTVTVIIP
jgi:hypothetical protein